MTQEAVVLKKVSPQMAEVVVTRGTACGGNCESCEACEYQTEMRITARNPVNAGPGERVVISCTSSKVYKAIFLVYVLPIVLMIVGYLIGGAAGLSEGFCILFSFGGLILGAAFVVWSQKRSTAIKFDYEITSKL